MSDTHIVVIGAHVLGGPRAMSPSRYDVAYKHLAASSGRWCVMLRRTPASTAVAHCWHETERRSTVAIMKLIATVPCVYPVNGCDNMLTLPSAYAILTVAIRCGHRKAGPYQPLPRAWSPAA